MASEVGGSARRGAAGGGTIWGLPAGRAALILFAVGILHRALQIWLIWPALSRQIGFTVGVQVQTMLPEITMRTHPWWGLWYLQQTPPLSYLVGVLVMGLFHDPYWLAVSCIMMQGALASAGQQRIQALTDWRAARLRLAGSLGRLDLDDAREH